MISSCSCRTLFDIAKKRETIVALDAQSAEAGFWNNQEKARSVMQQRDACHQDVLRFDALDAELADLCALAEMVTSDAEHAELEKQLHVVEQSVEKLHMQTLFDGEYDEHSAIISLFAGAGGVDAQDWTAMLLSMYLKWAEAKGFTVTILDKVSGAEAGIKSATCEMTGRMAYGHLRAETGVHRLVRLSPFNADNLRQTSFARVDVMPVIDEIAEVALDMNDVRVDTYRSSGAGGQSVNTTDSAVRVTHVPTGIQAQCQNERSQMQNKENALKLLKAKLHKKHLDEQQQKKNALRGDIADAGWGNQIRSYVLHPYKMVKDHRTKQETSHVEDVLDGDIDAFIMAFLQL